MEFLIEMNKVELGVKLKSVQADDLYDAVTKITTLLVEFCAKNPFAYRVKPIVMNPGMLEFYIFFDKRRRRILVYDPKVYADPASSRRMDMIKRSR